VLSGVPPLFMGGETIDERLYQAYGAPWIKNDPGAPLKNFSHDDYEARVTADRHAGAIPRCNGGLYYPAKISDLIGIKPKVNILVDIHGVAEWVIC